MTMLYLILLLLIGNVSFAQDEQAESVLTNHSLTLYMDYSSGVINKNEDNNNLLEGNETEFGLNWSTSFTQAQWLTLGFKGNILLHLDIESTPTNVTGIGPQGVYIKDPSAAAYISFLNYFNIEIDTLMRFKPSLQYTLQLGEIQSLKFYTGAEILMLSRPTGTATFDTLPQYLELFNLSLTYNVRFHRNLSLKSEMQFRFNGKGGANGIGGFVQPDSMEALINSFHIRWNNSLILDINNYSAYLQLRYQPENLTHNILDTVHKLSVHAGMSYRFDF